jgi:hypothetical protein
MNEQEQFKEVIQALARLDEVPPLNPLRKASTRRAYLEYAARLRTEVTVVSASGKARLIRSLVRLGAAGLSAFILAMGFLTGVAYAADGAQPGDLLYPIDRSVEDLRLKFTPDPERALQLLLSIADERVTESEQLALEGDEENMAAALEAYGQTISAIARTMEGAGNRQETLDTLVDKALSVHEERLLSIRAHAPDRALSGLDRAIEAAHNERKSTLPANTPEEAGEPQTTPGEGKPEPTPKSPQDKPNGPPGDHGPPDGRGPPDDHGPPDHPGQGGGH